eukprot:TRINITY_DN12374_c0_g1_i6.p1 TRINITY_DN12374_c0_g1~~TRINITY_DN12374_c0_g1_i6.p1  ORF type:complete len:544 (+),score=110.93 TRINITY_DN12374_c0_g1_i6:171-1802(+)
MGSQQKVEKLAKKALQRDLCDGDISTSTRTAPSGEGFVTTIELPALSIKAKGAGLCPDAAEQSAANTCCRRLSEYLALRSQTQATKSKTGGTSQRSKAAAAQSQSQCQDGRPSPNIVTAAASARSASSSHVAAAPPVSADPPLSVEPPKAAEPPRAPALRKGPGRAAAPEEPPAKAELVLPADEDEDEDPWDLFGDSKGSGREDTQVAWQPAEQRPSTQQELLHRQRLQQWQQETTTPQAPPVRESSAPPAPANTTPASASGSQSWRSRIGSMYERFNPQKLPELDDILAKYRGAEAELYEALRDKYVGRQDHAEGSRLEDFYQERQASQGAAAAAAREAPPAPPAPPALPPPRAPPALHPATQTQPSRPSALKKPNQQKTLTPQQPATPPPAAALLATPPQNTAESKSQHAAAPQEKPEKPWLLKAKLLGQDTARTVATSSGEAGAGDRMNASSGSLGRQTSNASVLAPAVPRNRRSTEGGQSAHEEGGLAKRRRSAHQTEEARSGTSAQPPAEDVMVLGVHLPCDLWFREHESEPLGIEVG